MNNFYTPRQSVNKAYLKIKPIRSDIEKFKTQLNLLIENVSVNESEEHQKNLLIDFFKKTYYGDDYFINTKDRIDLVIRNGSNTQSGVGVLFEIKRTTNNSEMLSHSNINTKALQELILYYLRERISEKNLELKHVIVTNINEWFIFDANLFEKAFAQNKKLVKAFIEFELDAGKDTNFFYNNIAKDAIESSKDALAYTYFNVDSYKKILKNSSDEGDSKLIALYKLLSPEHLLKKPFLNDSNSLNKHFYAELLHLIGLEEVKVGTKKLIDRKKEGSRNSGSLLESAILLIKSRQKLYQISNVNQYGDTEEEQIQSIAMELVITWINRILFLKLLEAQLLKYNKGGKKFSFLNSEMIKGFDELESLFFQVLAVKTNERDDVVRETFSNVPYLNSSLFEPTTLEHEAIAISAISDSVKLPILQSTVLKDGQGKRRDGELNTLTYLFEFLNAYDFTSDGGEEIQEDNKTLISASVLGLIFEKINGYKDGSFFTPSFVTMYMCREVITQSVLKKFKEVKGYDCSNLVELHNEIEDKKEANEIINSLKICDPAVGSGHFLVSALNEIIFIKSQLRLLQDKDGKSLKNYDIDVVNDELIITDEDGEFVDYFPKNKESQRLQETLFNEKQTIIENCLFGVDINPNSVKICRLRLWIELLKNAYYKEDGRLETLPNIDINIKVGDSLIGRFGIDSNLKEALKKSKINIKEYKLAVNNYKNATNKKEKRSVEEIIKKIKAGFKTEILQTDKRYINLWKLEKQLNYLDGPQSLFELDEGQINENDKLKEKLTVEYKKSKNEIEEIESNRIYSNAFEWRFEFSEVLSDDGDFEGFDVVIGNPPYIFTRELIAEDAKNFYNTNFKQTQFKINLYFLFVERAWHLLSKGGVFSFIIPNNWLSLETASNFRKFILSETKNIHIVNSKDNIFDNASVDTCILSFCKSGESETSIFELANGAYSFLKKTSSETYLRNKNYLINYEYEGGSELTTLFEKINSLSMRLEDIAEVRNGIQAYTVGEGNPVLTEEMKKSRVYHSNIKESDDWLKYVDGIDVCRFKLGWSGQFVKYGSNLSRPRKKEYFISERLLVRQIPAKPPYSILACYADEIVVNDNNSMIVINPLDGYSLKFILAILNSRLISFWFLQTFGKLQRKVFPQFKVKELREFPVRKIDFSSSYDLELCKKITDLVIEYEGCIDTDAVRSVEVNKLLDDAIYELYKLTPSEIHLVEGSSSMNPND